jgi:acetyltransferase-like isoleucine patch superfamily enzyme
MPGWLITLGRAAGGLVVFGMCATCASLALVPCWFLHEAIEGAAGSLWATLSIPFLYLVWGVSYCFLCVLYKVAIRYSPREGEWPLFSWPVVGWGTVGALTNFANHMFLVHFKGTAILNVWYRALGATIGHNVSINSVKLFEWNLLTIEDDVVLGGDCVVMGHALEGGRMRMRRVHLKRGAMVGGDAKVMPGCVLGERAVVGASSLLTKNTHVPDGQLWGGVPARFLRDRGARGVDAGVDGAVDGDTAADGSAPAVSAAASGPSGPSGPARPS